MNFRLEKEQESRLKWEKYLSSGSIDNLVETARDLFEVLQTESNGVISFKPAMKVKYEQNFVTVYYNPETSEDGTVINYSVESRKLSKYLHWSSDVEMEIYHRIMEPTAIPLENVSVFGETLTPEEIMDVFSKFPRNFRNTLNFIPFQIESAFNHIPKLNKSLEVKGIKYPHKNSNFTYR